MEDILRSSAQLGCMLADILTGILRNALDLDFEKLNFRKIFDDRWLQSFREEFQLLTEKES